VLRRVAAFAGIVLLVAVALLLMWRVYAHHRQTESDEIAVVALRGLAAEGKIFLTLR